MYTRADISLEDRMEIFSRFYRFQGDYGGVTQIAEEWRTSRRFIYDLAERVRHALDWQRPGRPEDDHATAEVVRLRQRVRELAADGEQLSAQLQVERESRQAGQFRLTMELALCPVSEDKIVRCLEAAFGRAGRCAVGKVCEQIQRAGEAALSIMQRPEVSAALHEAAIDEIFRSRQPILTLIDPHTLMAVVPRAAENRQGTTWKEALDQYPNLKQVVSDQGSGLLKGVALSERQIAHQYDLFHFKRELHRLLCTQEARCYEAMEQVERARKLIDAPRLLSSARVQATVEHREQAAALERRLEAFDWTEVIITYLEEHLSVFDERKNELRSFVGTQAVIDEVLALLGGVRGIHTQPLISLITGARAGLLTFLTILRERLDQIPIRWRHVEGSRRAVCDALARCWLWRTRAAQSRKCLEKYLAALTGLTHWHRRIENFTEVQERVYQALDQVVRASSAVECLNSLLRPYVSVKKHLSQGFLALIALYWNTHPLQQRGGRTPFQLSGVDLSSDDWIELLEREMQRIAADKVRAA
jgi:hypothetical protein